jgi:hypothetical protein
MWKVLGGSCLQVSQMFAIDSVVNLGLQHSILLVFNGLSFADYASP